MTSALGLERRDRRLALPQWLFVKGVIACARGIARMTPVRIESTMRFFARGATPATFHRTSHLRDTVVSASKRCAGQYCLERAIAVCLLSRLEDNWPTWCAGARIEPFMAHSWVEVDGVPVGEMFTDGFYAKLVEVGPPGGTQ